LPVARLSTKKRSVLFLFLSSITAFVCQASEPITGSKSAAGQITNPPRAHRILSLPVPVESMERRYWSAGQSMAGIAVPTPVLIARGKASTEGNDPVLCMTAAVHGDELNGVEIIRRVMFELDVSELRGTVIGVPIVNLPGFQRSSRYLPDRRDLNRFFPGDPTGSSASRIAYALFEQVIRECDYLIDLHTGSFHRTNLPQLRADVLNPTVLEFSKTFGDIAVLHTSGALGTLRRAAADAGIPAITIEAGEPLRLQPKEVSAGVNAVRQSMTELGFLPRKSQRKYSQPLFYESEWLRADRGGILLSSTRLGAKVKPGDQLGMVFDPITNQSSAIVSRVQGRILGMALNQMVMPGFAAFHIGIETDDENAAAELKAERAADDAVAPAREAAKQAAEAVLSQPTNNNDDGAKKNEAARVAAQAAAVDAVNNPPDSEANPSEHDWEGATPQPKHSAPDAKKLPDAAIDHPE
jgi:predicted deacylase